MLGGLAYQDPEHASIKDLDLKNLSQINSEIANTAVDVFVYDTRKDSDGGAWRKRTQNTSWYNETLGTATRGTRKEFPAVAVIVVETTRVIIYDGDDPDLPMWMVFESNSYGNMLGEATNACVAMFNAKISLGCSPHDLYVADFIQDGGVSYSTSSSISGTYYGNILQRNIFATPGSPANSWIFGTVPNIRNRTIYDLAMTALPNAPVDPSTGLPIPTIAIGTADGISVIKDDGRVVDYTNTATSHDVAGSLDINDSNEILYTFDSSTNSRRVYLTPILNKDTTTLLSSSHPIESTGTLGYGAKVDVGNYNGFLIGRSINHITKTGGRTFATGDEGGTEQNGLSLIDPQTNTTAGSKESLIAHISSTYNTGWMHGDIKGAFLSDTDTTNAVAVYYDGFSNNDNGWGFVNTSISGGNMVISQQGSARSTDYNALSGIATGTKLVFTFDVGGSGTGSVVIDDDGAGAGVGGVTNYGSFNSTGSKTFTATKTASDRIRLMRTSGSNDYTIDYLNITTEYDRSVNNKGLAIYGTITKEPVATGAELVAYTGFSASNYLQQAYNSNLDFGTGDYHMSIWAKGGGSNQCLMIREHGVNSGNGLDADGAILIFQGSSKYNFYSRQNGTATWTAFSANNAKYGDYWSHVVLVRTGGTLYGYVNGKLEGSTSFAGSVSNNDAEIYIGRRNPNVNNTQEYSGSLALARIGGSAPTAEQVKKMYEDEKHLFQENAKATLYGSSDAVTALGYDEDTELLHVGTSSGRSDFQGLRRINNTTTAVTTAISASNGLVSEQ